MKITSFGERQTVKRYILVFLAGVFVGALLYYGASVPLVLSDNELALRRARKLEDAAQALQILSDVARAEAGRLKGEQ